jgi:hypothetical protein
VPAPHHLFTQRHYSNPILVPRFGNEPQSFTQARAYMSPMFDEGNDEIVVDGKLPLITAVVGTMQFSPNGRYLAVGDDDGNLLVGINARGSVYV